MSEEGGKENFVPISVIFTFSIADQQTIEFFKNKSNFLKKIIIWLKVNPILCGEDTETANLLKNAVILYAVLWPPEGDRKPSTNEKSKLSR